MISTTRRFSTLLLVLFGQLIVTGCGGMNQDDIRKYAIKRPKEDESPAARTPAPPSPTPVATPANAPGSGTSGATNVAAAPVAGSAANPVAAPTPGVSAPGTPSVPAVGLAADTTAAPSGITDTRAPDPTLTNRDRRAMTIENLKRIAAAIEAYRAEQGAYPPFAVHSTGGRPLLSWRVAVLPYLGYQELYARFKLDEPWDSPNNQSLLKAIPSVYQSPERFDTNTNYLVPLGTSTAFREGPRGQHPRRWEDGLENIVICVEADDSAAVPWTAPMDLTFDSQSPRTSLGGLREDGFFAGWGGGSVLRVPAEVTIDQLRAMFSVDGGEAFSAYAVAKMPSPDVMGAIGRGVGPSAVVSSVPTSTTPSVTSSVPARRPGNTVAPGFAAAQGGPANYAVSATIGSAGGESLSEKASQAAVAGYQLESVQFAWAAFLVDEPTQAVAYQWFPGLRRPATVVRYGVGLDFAGNQADSVRRQFANMADDREFRGGRLQSVVGDLADPLLNQLQSVPPYLPPPCQVAPRVPGRPVAPTTSLQFVGVGRSTALVKAAQREMLDVLLMFDVEERVTRGGKKSKTVQFSVLDVWTGREIMSKQTVNYLKRENSQTDPLYRDPIDSISETFAKVLREQLSPQPIPSELKADHAERRVEMLARLRFDNPLPLLSEMKLYRQLDLVSVRPLMQSFGELLESEKAGAELLAGSPSEKRAAISRWIPNLDQELLQAAQRRAARDDDDD